MTTGAIELITAVFIVGMTWIRTRMQYPRVSAGSVRLERAGKVYFGALLGLLVSGWLVAPWAGRTFWPQAAVTPTLTRVVWSLLLYFAFIVVHRALRIGGVAVFKEHPAQ